MKTLALAALFLLSACGKPTEPLRFDTREVSPEEAERLGLASPEGGLPSPSSFGAVTTNGGVLVNSLAGVALKLLTPGENEFNATMLGHAVPGGVAPIELTGSKAEEKTYEKKLTSILGLTLIKAYYKIAYQYGAHHKGKGSYITNLKFVPLKVETDPLWNLRATALSDQPINSGTESKPVAKLGFSLTFTASAKAQGSRTVTDEFELIGSTGELKETIRNFED